MVCCLQNNLSYLLNTTFYVVGFHILNRSSRSRDYHGKCRLKQRGQIEIQILKPDSIRGLIRIQMAALLV